MARVKLPRCSASLSPPIFHSNPSLPPHNSVTFQSQKFFSARLHRVGIQASGKRRRVGAINASAAGSTVTEVEERWLLEPVGDGDSRHLGYKVEMPAAFEIVSSSVTVGRLPDKADIVIPVATVSAAHALIQKRGGDLLVTDLDSTNGTFINEKRLRPGAAANLSPGSLVTFGDTHLAIFRVTRLQNEEAASKSEQSENSAQTESQDEGKDPTT